MGKIDIFYKEEDIVEISIESKFVLAGSNDDYHYKDLLKISKHHISFKRKDYKTGELRSEWSYKTSKEIRFWWLLKTAIFEEFNKNIVRTFVSDFESFNLRVKFKDGEHRDLHLSPNFSINKMDDLASLIKQIIPSDVTEYPVVLNAIPLSNEAYPLTRENLKKLDKDNICSFMFAESGAMGSPGEMCIIDANGKKFCYHGFDSDDKCDISFYEITKKYLNNLKPIHGPAAPCFKECNINDNKWIYTYLGAGNHLYMREDFWKDYGDRVIAQDEVNRYDNWKHLINER